MFITPTLTIKEIPQGKAKDPVELLDNDKWLKDTEVRYHLVRISGLWRLTMAYVALGNPFNTRCRVIDHYSSETKALTYAQILQRGIRKDARGTLKANTNDLDICFN